MNSGDLTHNGLSTPMITSTSGEMLSYDVFDASSHMNCGVEVDNRHHYPEETGKYDLDTVSVFVAKLYQLLDGDDYKDYLTWNDTGDVFVICNMDEFAANVLPKFFKHCKFTSFVRQLNIYGFYRVSDARKSKHVRSKHACVFSHPQFRRSRQDLLPNIKRKVSKTQRRRPRPSEGSTQQGDNASTSPRSYGNVTSLKGNMANKDNNVSAPAAGTVNSLSNIDNGKEYHDASHRFEGESPVSSRTTDLNHLVSSLAEELQRQRTHLIELTQFVASYFPDGGALLRNFSKPLANESPESVLQNPRSKRIRLDTGNDGSPGISIKTEQTPISPLHYGLYSQYKNDGISGHQGQNNDPLLSSSNTSQMAVDSPMPNSTVTTPTIPMSSDPHSTFGSLMDDYHPQLSSQHNPNNPHSLAGFNDSWSGQGSVMIQDTVNSYNFLPTTSNPSPILYSPSAAHQPQSSSQSQQQGQQHSPQQQQPSPTPTIALSPTTAFVDTSNTTTSPNDLLSATLKANDGHSSGGNSPHQQQQQQQQHHEEIGIGAPSPHSPTASPPSEGNSLPSYYQQTSIVPIGMSVYGAHFSSY